MAFKKCTVASAKVAATLSSYPTYVDLARVGVTTLAEAQSIRVYADESKTTEWAREIVSATEMHVKIPSLTTTTTIYVDYDGVRSDYGFTDTYGRNAVWSDYAAVYHMNQDPSGSAPQIIDSTGNGNNATANGTMVAGDLVAAQIGDGLDFDTTNDYLSAPDSASLDITQATVQGWIRPTENTDNDFILKPANAGWTTPFASYLLRMQFRSGTGNDGVLFGINGGGSLRNANLVTETLSLNTWYFCHGTFDGTNIRAYRDGVLKGTTSYTGSITTSAQDLQIGNNQKSGNYAANISDEIRIRGTAVDSDWITTEYNNQSDEATFWPTWEDVGGGAVAKKGFLAWL